MKNQPARQIVITAHVRRIGTMLAGGVTPQEGFLQFWTGRGWSPEYPEAKIFSSMSELDAELQKWMGPLGPLGKLRCIENYGLETEREL